MGNYERTYGNDKFVTKLNAKELILKKINATQDWVDIYTTAFILGEDLNEVGKFMISPKVTSILNGYSSSIFNDSSNINKIKYLEKLLEISKSDPVLSALLDRVKDAEEIRVLGSILKINQGLPTRTSDKYRYIKGIESYLDSTINEDVYTVLRLAKVNDIDQLSKVLLDKFNIYYDSKFSENLDKFKEEHSFKVSLLQFLKDEQYKKELINKYEVKKRHFNILKVINLVPHFREMFKVLGIDSEVLNRLSVRNNLESLILNSIPKKLNNNQILEIRNAIDVALIEKWITDKNLNIRIAPKALGNDFEYTMTINNSEQITKFRNYMEVFVIPLLKEKLPNNKFIQNLVIGLKTTDFKNHIKIPFYKMPFNMVQVDNTEKTKLVYEEVLKDFTSLNGLKIDGIDMNLVDLFYLYNLIVNRDKFGPNSMTRIFEEVLNAPGNENLLVYDFNSWIDKQDPKELKKLVKISIDTQSTTNNGEQKSEDTTIGFKESPSESDIEETTAENEVFNGFKIFSNKLSSQRDWSNEKIEKRLKPNDNPENFNSMEESEIVVSSNRTILSNEELKYWNEQGVDDMPRILAASERTDPAFHVKEILSILEGKKTVPQWGIVDGQRRVIGNVSGKDFAGLYLITKHDGLPMKQLLETKIPKLIHFSITGLGGTIYEPGVMKYNDLLDKITDYIKQGLDPNSVTIRIDPIVPGVTKAEDIENIVKKASKIGIKRIRFSVMDAYANTVEAVKKVGYDFKKYYGSTNGRINFTAKPEYIKEIVDLMIQLKDKYGVTLGTCAENIARQGINKEGCLSVDMVNQMLGTSVEDKGTANNNQRALCSCYGGKIDALAYNKTCASHCIYCYAKHENDKALEYYNEDGTLKDNVYTRTRAKNSKLITDPQSNLSETWSKKEGWNIEYFNRKVKSRLHEAWQMEYRLSNDQESPVQLEGNMTYKYDGQQRSEVKALTTLEAIKRGERTATTRYESDGNIDYWKQAKVGDRIKFKSGNDFVIVEVIKPLTKLITDPQLSLFESTYYDTKPSNSSKLIEVIKASDNPYLHLVTTEDLVDADNNTKNANGFIQNGEIFINVDRASDDTIIHEFGHLYLADAKLKNPTEYYQLLSKVRQTELWSQMREMAEYSNKKGSDFDEEVLATMISNYYKNSKKNQDPFYESNSFENSIVLEALSLVSSSFKELLNSDILPELDGVFFTQYKDQQKIATVKNRLTNDGIIIENCK